VDVDAAQAGLVERPPPEWAGSTRWWGAMRGQGRVCRGWPPGAGISSGRSRRTSGSPRVNPQLNRSPARRRCAAKRSISSKSRISRRSTNSTSARACSRSSRMFAAVGALMRQVVVEAAVASTSGAGGIYVERQQCAGAGPRARRTVLRERSTRGVRCAGNRAASRACLASCMGHSLQCRSSLATK